VVDFTSSQLRQLTSPGGYWEARLALGLRQVFGFEVAYLGDAQSLSAPGTKGTLVGNGTEANLRVNLPMNRGPVFIAPYALAGMGWMHYDLGSGTDQLAAKDDVLLFPMGAGITVGRDRMYLDARFVYRLTALEDLVRDPQSGDGQLGHWSAGAAVGMVF
jgi:hypothetical protein